MIRTAQLALLSTFIGLSACAGTEAERGTQRELSESLRIGTVDGQETSLTSIGSVSVVDDSLVYVSQPRESRIRVFALTGRPVQSIGRNGRGPGEFLSLGAFGVAGEGVWVQDYSLAVIQYLNAEGREVRRSGFSPVEVVDEGISIRGPVRPWQDGFVGVVDRFPVAWLAQHSRVVFPVLEFSAEGEVIDTLTHLIWPSNDGTISLRQGSGNVYFGIPLSEKPAYAFAATEDAVAVLDREVGPATPGYRISVVGPSSDTVYSQFQAVEPIPLEGELLQRFIGALGEHFSVEQRRAAEEEFSKFPYLPAANRVFLDSDLRAWVSREWIPGESIRWDVFSRDGAFDFWVELPDGARVVWSEEDSVWVAETGILGEPQLVQYRVGDRIGI